MREEEQPMPGEVATIKRESFQTTEREEIENLRQIYGDKWYKEQLQVKIDYSHPPLPKARLDSNIFRLPKSEYLLGEKQIDQSSRSINYKILSGGNRIVKRFNAG